MNVAHAQPRTWTPQVIAFSVLFHLVLLYYVVTAFKVIPQDPVVPQDPPVIDVFQPQPPPPVAEVDPNPVKLPPIHRPDTTRPTQVQPIPAPEPTPTTTNVQGIPNSSGPITAEAPIDRTTPAYPQTAINDNVEGRVTLSITINPDGTVRDVTVLNAQPRGYFEKSAVRAVQRWRYKPTGTLRTNVVVTVDYVLS